MPNVEMQKDGTQIESGWQDVDGFVGPFQPGFGPRSDPKGKFPTGPDVGQTMLNIQTMAADGSAFDLEQARAGRPAVFIFFRSAVW